MSEEIRQAGAPGTEQLRAQLRNQSAGAAEIAAAMLAHDRAWLPLPVLMLLILPKAGLGVDVMWPATFGWSEFAVAIADWVFMGLVLQRWLLLFRNDRKALPAGGWFRLIGSGLLIWLPFKLCLFLTLNPHVAGEFRVAGMLLLVPSFGAYLRLYFYFLPALCSTAPLSELLARANQISAGHRLAALKAHCTPLFATLLLIAMVRIPSPDERELGVTLVRLGVSGFLWMLTTYISIGFAFVLLSEKEWHDCGLDPYREARRATMALQSPKLLAKVLEPRNGLKFILPWILLNMANTAMLFARPPAAQVTVAQVTIQGKHVILDLLLRDDKYRFRGFHPYLLTLAGPNRIMVADPQFPLRSSLNGKEDPLALYELPASEEELALQIEFQCDRGAEALQGLRDLHLWYLNSRLAHLDMQGAKVLPPG